MYRQIVHVVEILVNSDEYTKLSNISCVNSLSYIQMVVCKYHRFLMKSCDIAIAIPLVAEVTSH